LLTPRVGKLASSRIEGRKRAAIDEPRRVATEQPDGIILGDAIQQGLTQDDYSVTGAVIVVSVFAALQVSISYISFRSRRLRPILQGEPIVLVQDGSLIESNLRRERLTAGEVAEAARQEQIASIADVQWAVLETSGKISFIPKSSS
jgi:uncharacterized membrane protein YcaP (DUF421 family)